MADPKKGGNKRSERLRAALRENLKRRKAQAKGRSAQDVSARDDDVDVRGPAGSPNSAGFAPDKPKV